ncbi:TPA: hypothetical protein REG82_002886 [Listeria monocytogenes]|uniref:hypothetical protein n=1 Tax=Listeria monocytogenes TaxID=1639 RepID=UPI00138874A6|nr:hypothetical protein [Listeria monocytogenes]HAA2916848.1 hypothetical protein [Listeria monocytogenes]HAA2949618.1 hypothetical protein [Listeria monocytogenes]HAA5590958.1 hypothetical protein [Listeria monocytogenes]HAC4193761.1 hypothetical protein [Listeria monocytogenes]
MKINCPQLPIIERYLVQLLEPYEDHEALKDVKVVLETNGEYWGATTSPNGNILLYQIDSEILRTIRPKDILNKLDEIIDVYYEEENNESIRER